MAAAHIGFITRVSAAAVAAVVLMLAIAVVPLAWSSPSPVLSVCDSPRSTSRKLLARHRYTLELMACAIEVRSIFATV